MIQATAFKSDLNGGNSEGRQYDQSDELHSDTNANDHWRSRFGVLKFVEAEVAISACH